MLNFYVSSLFSFAVKLFFAKITFTNVFRVFVVIRFQIANNRFIYIAILMQYLFVFEVQKIIIFTIAFEPYRVGRDNRVLLADTYLL